MSLMLRASITLSVLALVLNCALARAVELNPAAVTFKVPDQIEWKTTNEFPGLETSVLAGDPSKPGLYVVMAKWLAGNHFSRPHFHPHDRFITVSRERGGLAAAPSLTPMPPCPCQQAPS
jgi:hypothetical protein